MKKLALADDLTITSLGQIFAQSGYFQDAKDAAQAVVKILAGQELGLPPIASMTGINIIKGKVSLSAVAMATVLKKYGGYDYRVKENSEEAVEIEFFFEGESIGISRFTAEDAKRAGLLGKDNYKKYPRNMLFARAMSNGIRWYCPDVLGGPAYTPGELETEIAQASDETVNGEVIDSDPINQVNEFAIWLEEEQERQTALNGIRPLVLELAQAHDGKPSALVASAIFPEVKSTFRETYDRDIKQRDIIEILKGE